MIQILVMKDDQGNLSIRTEAPPYVVIGELAQAIALLTAQIAAHQVTEARRVLPANSDELLRLPRPNQG